MVAVHGRDIPAILAVAVAETAAEFCVVHDLGDLQSENPCAILPEHGRAWVFKHGYTRHFDCLVFHGDRSEDIIRISVSVQRRQIRCLSYSVGWTILDPISLRLSWLRMVSSRRRWGGRMHASAGFELLTKDDVFAVE